MVSVLACSRGRDELGNGMRSHGDVCEVWGWVGEEGRDGAPCGDPPHSGRGDEVTGTVVVAQNVASARFLVRYSVGLGLSFRQRYTRRGMVAARGVDSARLVTICRNETLRR